jgi:hypothetical protein
VFQYDANGNRTSRFLEGSPEKISQVTLPSDSLSFFPVKINPDNPTEREIIIYPNPSSGEFTLGIEDNSRREFYSIKIFSITGLLVHSETTDDYQKLINLSSSGSGVYFISIEFSCNSYKSKLVIL